MNIFNIIGPVMIGPSSSHTAGACRIGRVVNKLAGDARIVRVRIQLSGSFARTYQGHGTDRAILAGILGYYSWSEELRDSMRIAAERGLSYEFVPEDIPGTHPNTARVYYECDNGKQGMVEGASIGGGNIQITNLNSAPRSPGRHCGGHPPHVREVRRPEYRQLPSEPEGKGR